MVAMVAAVGAEVHFHLALVKADQQLKAIPVV
jgi:hypothetical protein